MTKQPPVQIGQELTATMGPLADGPDAICRVDDYAIFVSGGLPGETLRIKVTETDQKHGRAEILTIEVASKNRAEAGCKHFGSCAGCTNQLITYAEQCAQKQAHVGKLMRDHLRRDVEIAPMRHPASGYGQRNRFSLRLEGEPGQLHGTLNGSKRKTRVNIEECPAVDPKLVDVALAVIAQANKYKLPMAEPDVDGLVGLLLRSSPSTGAIHVTIIGNVGRLPHGLRLTEAAAEKGANCVSLNINLESDRQVLGRRNVPLLGVNQHKFEVDGLAYHAAPSTPFGWSDFGTRAIVEVINELCGEDPEGTAIDIFSGGGLLTLQLARKFGKVIGIEPFRDATTDAEASARANEMENVTFVQGNVQEITLDLDNEFPQTVVVSPPASGLRPDMITGIARILRTKRILYVSSSPGSLARDIKHFEEHPYKVHSIHPIDMLPMSGQTTVIAAIDRDVD